MRRSDGGHSGIFSSAWRPWYTVRHGRPDAHCRRSQQAAPALPANAHRRVGVLWCGTVAFCVLWVRSYFARDELVGFGKAGIRTNIATDRGSVLFMRLSNMNVNWDGWIYHSTKPSPVILSNTIGISRKLRSGLTAFMGLLFGGDHRFSRGRPAVSTAFPSHHAHRHNAGGCRAGARRVAGFLGRLSFVTAGRIVTIGTILLERMSDTFTDVLGGVVP